MLENFTPAQSFLKLSPPHRFGKIAIHHRLKAHLPEPGNSNTP
jgi:hypothetical protein